MVSSAAKAIAAAFAGLLLAAGCVGGQSTDDFVPGKTPGRQGGSSRQPDMACLPDRTPIAQPDPQLLDTIARLATRYAIAGRWALTDPRIDFTPADAPFAGELALERRDGELVRLTGNCGGGIEIPVRVSLRTDDGALAESVDGIARLSDVPVFMPLDGSPPVFTAQVEAQLQLNALDGSFRGESSQWKFGSGLLRADVTPIGSRGTLQAQLEFRKPPKLGPNERLVSPVPVELLRWPAAGSCADTDEGAHEPFGVSSASSPALATAVEQLVQESFPAEYDDGTTTMVRVEVELPDAPVCSSDGLRIPARARMRTDDGRLDVSFGVTLDPGFAQLHFNNRTDVGWAFPPAQLAERIGHIDAELDTFAHVGLEAWFDKAPEAQGWIKVLGYAPGDCLLCEGDSGCIECSWERRVVVLSLFIGAEIGRQH